MEPLEPYRPPHSDLTSETSQGDGSGVSANMVESLRRTRVWVLLMGVLGMFGCALMVLVGIAMAIFSAVGGMGGEFSGFPGVAFGLVYLLMALLYFFPALSLLRYGGAIKRITGTSSTRAIEEALRYQASFWRYLGMMMIAVVALYAVGFVVAIGFGILNAAG